MRADTAGVTTLAAPAASDTLPTGESSPASVLRAGVWISPQHPAESAWTAGELAGLLEVAPARTFTRGAGIYHQGDVAEGFFLVLEGQVKLSTLSLGGERLLALCGPGNLFGVNRCGGEQHYPAQAVAHSPEARLVSVSCAALHRLSETQPSLSTRLVGTLSRRIGALEEQLEQARLPVQARLARTLLTLTHRLGLEVAPALYEVTLGLRHDEIASLAGAGRVSVTQALSAWRRMGIVSGTRGRYQVDVARLRALSELLEVQSLG